jgi:hypothetical protein
MRSNAQPAEGPLRALALNQLLHCKMPGRAMSGGQFPLGRYRGASQGRAQQSRNSSTGATSSRAVHGPMQRSQLCREGAKFRCAWAMLFWRRLSLRRRNNLTRLYNQLRCRSRARPTRRLELNPLAPPLQLGSTAVSKALIWININVRPIIDSRP